MDVKGLMHVMRPASRPDARFGFRRSPVVSTRAPQHSDATSAIGASRRIQCCAGIDTGVVACEAPSTAEIARTVVEIVNDGTLVTLCEDGTPLGTYITFVLDADGQPVLRLRTNAVHTENLLRDARCSLFVHPKDMPARLLARVTLVGSVEPVEDSDVPSFSARHEAISNGAVGVDVPHTTDLFYRLKVEKCLYVGGLGSNAEAETVPFDAFRGAEPDLLREEAPQVVSTWNTQRREELHWIAAAAMGCRIRDVMLAELLWVDRLGAYLKCANVASPIPKVSRVAFERSAHDVRDALSILTMKAQVSWELALATADN